MYSMVNLDELCKVLQRMNAKSNRHLIFGAAFAWYAYNRIKTQEKEIHRLKRDVKQLKKELIIFDNKENKQCDD